MTQTLSLFKQKQDFGLTEDIKDIHNSMTAIDEKLKEIDKQMQDVHDVNERLNVLKDMIAEVIKHQKRRRSKPPPTTT